jgi:hypothetical protein
MAWRVDQYIVFPFQVKKRQKNIPSGTYYFFFRSRIESMGSLVEFSAYHTLSRFSGKRSAIGEIPP